MKDEQKGKSILDIINQHPGLRKNAKKGGIGLLFSVLLSIAIKYISGASFDEVMEWLEKLKSLILSLPSVVSIPLTIFFLVFIFCYKKLNDKGKFKQKFLKDAKDMIESDSTISNISIQEDKKGESLSINIQRDHKRNLNTKAKSNVVDFQHYNSEVK